MGMTNYDRAHFQEIIDGEGTWFTAHVIRFIAKVWGKADSQNKAILRMAFPDVVEVYEYNLLSPEERAERLVASIVRGR